MSMIDERVADLLKSPLGCAFLIIGYESGLTPKEMAQADIALNLGAFAANEMGVWRADRDRVLKGVQERGPQHADLARTILEEPDADRWFGPPDGEHQIYVPQDGNPPDLTRIVTPTQPPSRHERYAQRVMGGFSTSTFVGETSSLFAAIDHGVGDLSQVYSRPPYPFWLLTVDTSARILEIDRPQAWHDLCVSYPAEGICSRGDPDFSGDKGRLVPDWSAVSADWDAVHLTFGGWLTSEQVRVDSRSGWTYLWDGEAEHTRWLHWKFTSSQQMPYHQQSTRSEQWNSLSFMLPQDNNHQGHIAPLRRLFRGPGNR